MSLLHLIGSQEEVKLPYVTFSSTTPMTITPKYTNSGVTLQYSTDAATWVTIASGSKTASANTLYFRGMATGTKSLFTSSSSSNAWAFTGATYLEVTGDLTCLLSDSLGGDGVLSLGSYAFAYMFYFCTSLTTAPSLPATSLADYCYYFIFSYCSKLTTVPDLPATSLARYCYRSMFSNCTSLTTAPSLPATNLPSYCYAYMFNGCSKLTTAPDLPVTILADYCYQCMFKGCTSLTTAPSLPATSLNTGCYQGMFNSCSSLTTAPDLSATSLANYCYDSMFNGCTSLTTAPSLPATILADYCYAYMFNGCSKLKFSTTLTGEYTNAYRIPTIGTGTTATNWSASMITGTGGTFTGTPVVDTTYYTSNTIV